MWYVIWTGTGKESDTRQLLIEKMSKTVYDDIVIPKKNMLQKFHGEWRQVIKKLYPGYLFVITDTPEEMINELERISFYKRILKTGDCIEPISRHEEKYLSALISNDQTVGVSSGIIINDRVIVKSGPLVGMEGIIKRIDRHKRLAYIDMDFFNRKVTTSVALEIVSKA
ncbi:MAG: antiterminator LoaP [Candidatus Weimeria sp.]